jgi:hypothetical protein
MIDLTSDGANSSRAACLAVVDGHGRAVGQVCDLVTSKASGRVLLVVACRTSSGSRLMVVPWQALERAQGGDLLLDFPQVVIDQLPSVRCAKDTQRAGSELLRRVRRYYGLLAA